MPSITELRDTLISLPSPPDDGSGRALHERLDELRMLSNVLDHQIAVHTALFDATGTAARAGSTTRNALIEMGMPPAAAHRYVRIAGGLESVPKVADCAAEGYLSAECVDAVIRGLALIDKRSATTLSDDDRRVLARWAADCAGRVVDLFVADDDSVGVVRNALDRTRAYARGESTAALEIARRMEPVTAARSATTPAAGTAHTTRCAPCWATSRRASSMPPACECPWAAPTSMPTAP